MTERHPDTELYAKHINPAFVKLLGTFGYGRVFVEARGTRLWDAEGREYLDFLAGFGAVNFGHNPPELIEAAKAALEADLPNVLHVGPQPWAGRLGEALARLAPELPMAILAQSGGEAVEAAMKLARAVTGRTGFVFCDGGFHGTGFGALSVMGEPRMRKTFEPLLEGTVSVPFGELAPLEEALAEKKHAAFVVEPVQGEGGVHLPPPDYLREAARLCRERGTLLVLDEVQTGLGRLGADLGYQLEEVVPDVLVLGKSLGGSLVPISAALTTEALHREAFGSMDTFDLCSTTFSGYAIGCRVALAALEELRAQSLSNRAERLGRRLLDGLRNQIGDHPLVQDVRGRGLLVGIELGPTDRGLLNRLAPSLVDAVSEAVFGQWLALRLLEDGIVAQPASQAWNVLRLEPPLTVSHEEIDRVVDAIGEILGEYRSLPPLLADVTRRLGGQLTSGWAFR